MYDERWYRRAGRGAVAGCTATALMSAVQFTGASAAHRLAPPIEITKRLHRRLHLGRPRRTQLEARGVALHVLFGSVAGALYGAVAPRRRRELSAVGYSGAIFASSYFGSLPVLGLYPPATRDRPRRALGNALAHLVFGLALAAAMRLGDPLRPKDSEDSEDSEGSEALPVDPEDAETPGACADGQDSTARAPASSTRRA